jgi:hypothetical protein
VLDVEKLQAFPFDPRVVTTIVVCAAVIEDGPVPGDTAAESVHLEGHWEFPGGKCKRVSRRCAPAGDPELDVEATVVGELLATTHR